MVERALHGDFIQLCRRRVSQRASTADCDGLDLGADTDGVRRPGHVGCAEVFGEVDGGARDPTDDGAQGLDDARGTRVLEVERNEIDLEQHNHRWDLQGANGRQEHRRRRRSDRDDLARDLQSGPHRNGARVVFSEHSHDCDRTQGTGIVLTRAAPDLVQGQPAAVQAPQVPRGSCGLQVGAFRRRAVAVASPPPPPVVRERVHRTLVLGETARPDRLGEGIAERLSVEARNRCRSQRLERGCGTATAAAKAARRQAHGEQHDADRSNDAKQLASGGHRHDSSVLR